MSAGLIRFPGEPVAQHADLVEQVAEIVEATGRAEPIAPAAYGILCRFLPAVLNPVVEVGTGALRTAAGELAALASRLRTTSGAMSGTDEASATRITGATPGADAAATTHITGATPGADAAATTHITGATPGAGRTSASGAGETSTGVAYKPRTASIDKPSTGGDEAGTAHAGAASAVGAGKASTAGSARIGRTP